MFLNLRYPPTPENAARFAADIVQVAERVSGVALDYSPESLDQVEAVIGGFEEQGQTSEQIGETLFGFGCYIGEVFVRNAGGTWQLASETKNPELFSFPLVVRLPNGSACNPIGKAFKRLDLGAGENLRYFYASFAGGGPFRGPASKATAP